MSRLACLTLNFRCRRRRSHRPTSSRKWRAFTTVPTAARAADVLVVPLIVSVRLARAADSFGEFWRRLETMRSDGDAWAAATIKTIEAMSPTSVRVRLCRSMFFERLSTRRVLTRRLYANRQVTFEQMRRGATLSLAECFEMEYVMAQVERARARGSCVG